MNFYKTQKVQIKQIIESVWYFSWYRLHMIDEVVVSWNEDKLPMNHTKTIIIFRAAFFSFVLWK